MPRRSKGYRSPREWLADGEWPEGTVVEDAPTAVRYAVEIAKRLEGELQGRSKTEVARRANIERSTLYDLLSGQTWPDAVTLANLEEVLRVRLWPDLPESTKG